CARPAKRRGPELCRRRPRQTICAQFPPLWGNTLTCLSPKNMKTERRPLSTRRESLFEGQLTSLRIPHTSAEGAGPPGGQPQNYPDKSNEEVLDCQRGRWPFGDGIYTADGDRARRT